MYDIDYINSKLSLVLILKNISEKYLCYNRLGLGRKEILP